MDLLMTFQVSERVGHGGTPLRVGRIVPGMRRVRIGDSHHQVSAADLAGQQVFEVIVVEDLEPAVCNAHWVHALIPDVVRL